MLQLTPHPTGYDWNYVAAGGSTFTDSGSNTCHSAGAAFTYPTNGQANVDTTKPFTWSTVPAAQGYYMTIGTTNGGYDLVDSRALPASQSSYNVPALPTGQTLYARIYTELNGNYNNYQDITFTAAPGGGSPAARTSAKASSPSVPSWLTRLTSRPRSPSVPSWLSRLTSRTRSGVH